MTPPGPTQTTIARIKQQIRMAIQRIVHLRKEEGFYRDDQESSDKYYFPTLEGLEAILIPSLALGYKMMSEELPDIVRILKKDVEYVLEFNTGKNKRRNQGRPYFVTGRRAAREYYWISECGAFTLSTLINVLLAASLSPETAEIFDEHLLYSVVNKNLQDILACKSKDGGWSWSTKGKTSDAWATWSIVETLSDYLAYAAKSRLDLPSPKRVDAALQRVRVYLGHQLDLKDKNSLSSRWRSKVLERGTMNTDGQVELSYAFIQTMISASLVGLRTHTDFLTLAADLCKSVDAVKVRRVENTVRVASKKTDIQDYSFHPTLLRAITSIYVQMTPGDRRRLSALLPKPFEHYMRKQYCNLEANYIVSGSWQGLWGHRKSYEIYYTERALEALVSLLEALAHSGVKKMWTIREARRPSRRDLVQEVHRFKQLSSRLNSDGGTRA
jgi:hypothetical protein